MSSARAAPALISPLTQFYGVRTDFVHPSTIRVRLPDRKARSCVTSPPFPLFSLSPPLARSVSASPRPPRAGQGHAFTVAANDGYGVQDCLGESGECGRAVADAWCAAEGRGAALSYGRADGRGLFAGLCRHLRRLSRAASLSASNPRISGYRLNRPTARSARWRSNSSANRRSACPNKSYRPGYCA